MKYLKHFTILDLFSSTLQTKEVNDLTNYDFNLLARDDLFLFLEKYFLLSYTKVKFLHKMLQASTYLSEPAKASSTNTIVTD